MDPGSVATTIISVAEQLEGRFKVIRKADQRRKERLLPEAYGRLKEAVEFFQSVQVLDFTQEAERCYHELRRNGLTPQRVDTLDLRIGCIALCLGATVITRNTVHFRRIPGLLVDDWRAELAP